MIVRRVQCWRWGFGECHADKSRQRQCQQSSILPRDHLCFMLGEVDKSSNQCELKNNDGSLEIKRQQVKANPPASIPPQPMNRIVIGRTLCVLLSLWKDQAMADQIGLPALLPKPHDHRFTSTPRPTIDQQQYNTTNTTTTHPDP